MTQQDFEGPTTCAACGYKVEHTHDVGNKWLLLDDDANTFERVLVRTREPEYQSLWACPECKTIRLEY